jgi:hypothetical protein
VAGRYRVEDLLDEVGAVRSWRAVDEVLSRPVYVQTVPNDDNAAELLSTAARTASHVADPRFLQILDVDDDDGISYVVREWVAGRDLKSILADGPLDSEQAAALGREVAEALTAAHRSKVHHLRLAPGNVFIAPDGSVKIGGLATEAALHHIKDDEPDTADAVGVGRLLYAALTARWPGDGEHGLDQPLRVDGRFASPRQVRPGVPRILDEVVDRALGNGDRHHASPLLSPASIADALARGPIHPRSGGVLGESDEDQRPPAILDTPTPMITANHSATFIQTNHDRDIDRPTAVRRVIGVVVGLIFLVASGYLGVLLLTGGGDDETAAGNPPVTTPPDEVDEDPVSNPEPDEDLDEDLDEPIDDPETEEPELESGVQLQQPQPAEVGGGARINLVGSIEPAAEGVQLRVERRLDNGDWLSFPDNSSPITTSTDAGGAFSTWVQTSRSGSNDWRLVGEIDGEPVESNIVTVIIN